MILSIYLNSLYDSQMLAVLFTTILSVPKTVLTQVQWLQPVIPTMWVA
jgi:hypothetical protein